MVPEKKLKKAVVVPAPVEEIKEMESDRDSKSDGEEYNDFRYAGVNYVRVEIPSDIFMAQGGEEAEATRAISATFLTEVMAYDHNMDLGEVDEERL